MSDIQMRFHKDMLVLSGHFDAQLKAQGLACEQGRELLNVLEDDSLLEIYRLEKAAGAQCLVTNTSGITRARLAHQRLEERACELAQAALQLVRELSPQHIIFELGPCGLPLDPSQASSLKQTREQYAQVARDLKQCAFDAYLLGGFASRADLQCALMGIRMVSTTPLMVCLQSAQNEAGEIVPLDSSWDELACLCEDYGADVFGFASAAAPGQIAETFRNVRGFTSLPLFAELVVGRNSDAAHRKDIQAVHTDTIGMPHSPAGAYSYPESVADAALCLREAGVQFLRASGESRPAHTAALAASISGLDVMNG